MFLGVTIFAVIATLAPSRQEAYKKPSEAEATKNSLLEEKAIADTCVSQSALF